MDIYKHAHYINIHADKLHLSMLRMEISLTYVIYSSVGIRVRTSVEVCEWVCRVEEAEPVGFIA